MREAQYNFHGVYINQKSVSCADYEKWTERLSDILTSSRRYSPTSAWWKTMMAVGSNLRVSTVERAVTPKPYLNCQNGSVWDEVCDALMVCHSY